MSHRKKRSLVPFESKDQPLLSRAAFAWRLAGSLAWAVAMIAFSLALGMSGYRYFEGMDWIDAYVNASMILSGMGPLGDLKTWGGKFFAGSYALYSGLAVVIVTGFLLAPIVHRMLHKFHLEETDARD